MKIYLIRLNYISIYNYYHIKNITKNNMQLLVDHEINFNSNKKSQRNIYIYIYIYIYREREREREIYIC